MTIATIATVAPVSLITAAVLILGSAAIGIANAETVKPPAQPAAAVIQRDIADGTWPSGMDQEITVEFSQTDINDVLAALRKLTGLSITLDPKITPHLLPLVTMSVAKMRTENVLRWVERLTRTHHDLHDGRIFLTQGTQAPEPDSDIGKPWKQAFDQKLTKIISLDLANTSFLHAVQFIRNAAGINIILTVPPEEVSPITLKIDKMTVRDTLAWLTSLENCQFEQRDQAVAISAKPPAAKAPATTVAVLAHVAAVRDNPQGQQDLVLLTIDKNSRIQEGTEFIVYRVNQYVVKLRVDRVIDGMLVCHIIPGSWNTNHLKVLQGDLATNRI